MHDLTLGIDVGTSTTKGVLADIKDGLLGCRAACAFRDVHGGAFREPAYVRTETSGGTTSWLVGNGLLERTLKFSSARGLLTETFRHKVGCTDFLKRNRPETHPTAEFLFQVDGESFRGAVGGRPADFTLVGSQAKDLSAAGKLLEIQLKAQKNSLEVSVLYAAYRGHVDGHHEPARAGDPAFACGL